ncbi:MAG: polysaccharide biosynthesis tyrosine autokinase, partial [Corynebacterium flavescens]|uniref:polysaccharide biosynthesis tyrosine autokinase n=1 Tax=Corynebacterium flavescens TaxID=28028 RepID=UPI003F97718E
GASFLMTPKYETKTQLYVSVRNNAASTADLAQGANFSRQVVNSYVDLINTGVVLDPVIEQLGLDETQAELAKSIKASSPAESALINITVTREDPEQAAEIANSVGESFKNAVATQLEPETEAGPSPISITTTQTALEPETAVSPRLLLNVALGLLIGFAAGFAIALLKTVLDTRIRSQRDVEMVTEKPILGSIVEDADAEETPLVRETQRHSPRAEAFRALRTNLQFFNLDSQERVFVVTSASPGEGKSTVSVNLALSLAQTEAKVLLIEADLRRPKVSKYLELEGGAGLTDVLIGRADADDVIQRWGRTSLYLLPAGKIPPNPSELLGSQEMKTLLKDLGETYDYVIIDTPPVLAVTDAVVAAEQAAGVLMVAAAGSTKRQSLDAALATVDTAGVKVLGLVLTRLPIKGPDSYGYETYGYANDAAGDTPKGSASHRQKD